MIKKIKVTGTPKAELSKVTSSENVCNECTVSSKISKLELSFNNEDLNKLVEKINEIIENK